MRGTIRRKVTNITAAQTFRALHHGPAVLLIPNAWDAGSAVLVKSLGAKAVATTSAGVAWSCGYADGDVLPRKNLVFAVESICRVAAGLPVSVDLEGGYSDDPATVADLVAELASLGVAGINLEDRDESPETLVAKIEAIKRGAPIFVNARADLYLQGRANGEAGVQESVERGKRYMQAGADGFFVPAVDENDAIRRIAQEVPLPLNVLAVAGLAPAGELFDMGVRRISAGSLISKRAFSTARRAATAFLQPEPAPWLFKEEQMSYSEINALFAASQ